MSTEATAEAHCVGESSLLPEKGRIHVKVQGRHITVLRLEGKLHAIDSTCFHAGGPLGIGDIEEVNGNTCLICPWHYYKIDVCTGDKYYQSANWEDGKMKLGDWKSNGVKQRVHTANEADGNIYVILNTEGTIDSDAYAFNEVCGERNQQKQSLQGVGGDGRRVPSGWAFQSRGK